MQRYYFERRGPRGQDKTIISSERYMAKHTRLDTRQPILCPSSMHEEYGNVIVTQQTHEYEILLKTKLQ